MKTQKITITISNDPVEAYQQALAAREQIEEAITIVLKAAVKAGHNPGTFSKATGTGTGAMRRAMRTAGVWEGERRPRTEKKAEAKPAPKAVRTPKPTRAARTLSKKTTAATSKVSNKRKAA